MGGGGMEVVMGGRGSGRVGLGMEGVVGLERLDGLGGSTGLDKSAALDLALVIGGDSFVRVFGLFRCVLGEWRFEASGWANVEARTRVGMGVGVDGSMGKKGGGTLLCAVAGLVDFVREI